MANQTIVSDILVKFKVDQASQAQVLAATRKIEADIGGIGPIPAKYLPNYGALNAKADALLEKNRQIRAQIDSMDGKTGGSTSIVGIAAASVLLAKAPEIGLAIGNAIARAMQGAGYKTQTLGDVSKTGQVFALGVLVQITNILRDMHAISGELREDVAKWARGVADLDPSKWPATIEAFMNFKKAQADAEEKYEDQRTEIVESAGKQRVQIEQTAEQQRTAAIAAFAREAAKAAADFARAEASATAAYYAQRVKLAQSFSIEVQRAEQDHQKAMRRLRRDFLAEVADLEGQRDAIGIVLAKRAFDRQRDDAEEDYQIASQRRSQDFARQLAEMEANFIAARNQRYADYQLQQQERIEQQKLRLAEIEANRKADLLKLNQATTEKLKDLATAYNKERIARINAFNEMLADLGIFVGHSLSLTARLAAAAAALDAYLQSQGITGRAEGGPVVAGRAYIVGERRPELFIPRQNGTILPSVGGAGGINLTQNIRYSGEVTSTSRREIAKIARESALEGITAAMGA